MASSAWPEPQRLEGAKSGYQLPEPSTRLPAGNLTGTWRKENIYPWCQVPCGGGNSIFGLDQEEGIGCVVPITFSRDLSTLLPGSLSASTASLAPSFCFCSFYFLATSHYLPPSRHLPRSVPDRLNYSKRLRPATSSLSSLYTQCSLPASGVGLCPPYR